MESYRFYCAYEDVAISLTFCLAAFVLLLFLSVSAITATTTIVDGDGVAAGPHGPPLLLLLLQQGQMKIFHLLLSFVDTLKFSVYWMLLFPC